MKSFEESMRANGNRFVYERVSLSERRIFGSVCNKCHKTSRIMEWEITEDGYKCPFCNEIVQNTYE